MASNYDSKCIMLWEYIGQTTGQNNPNNQIPHRPGSSYELTTSPMQYFPSNAASKYPQVPPNVHKNSGNNLVLNYLVPAENANVDSSVRIGSSATVDNTIRIDNDAREDNSGRLNTETQRKVMKRPKFNPFPPKKSGLNEDDLKLIRDHLAGKIKLGIDFMRYLHNIPKPIPRAEPKCDPELILAKGHRWSTWVCEPYPKVKPKNDPKFLLPKSDGWATTWDEIRGGVIGPTKVDEGKSSETEAEGIPLLSNKPEEPPKSSDGGIIVSIFLNKLTRIPEKKVIE